MPYTRRTWANAPATTTPITASSLNNIEDGVEEATDAVRGRLSEANLDATIGSRLTEIRADNAFQTPQQVLNSALPGDVVRFVTDYTIPSGQSLVPMSDTTVLVSAGVTLTRTDRGFPVFDAFNKDDVTVISQGSIVSTAARVEQVGYTPSSVYGAGKYERDAAFWTNGNRNTFTVTETGSVVNLTAGAVFSNWSSSLNRLRNDSDGQWLVGNKVAVRGTGLEFGILYWGQDGIELTHCDVRGLVWSSESGVPEGGAPPHAIYSSGTSTRRSKNVRVTGPVYCEDCAQAAYQFKYTDNLRIDVPLNARRTGGLVVLNGVTDVVAVGGTLTEVVGSKLILVDVQLAANAKLGSFKLKQQDLLAADTTAVIQIGTGSSKVEADVEFEGTITDADSTATMVNVYGSDSTVRIRGRMLGSYEARLCRVIANDVSVGIERAKGFSQFGIVGESANAQTGVHFDINPNGMSSTKTGQQWFRTVHASGTVGYTISRREKDTLSTLTAGQASAPNPHLETRRSIRITTTSATYVSAPNPTGGYPEGFVFEVAVVNASGGALNLSWNAVYGTVSWTPPADGKGAIVRFRYTSGAWVQV